MQNIRKLVLVCYRRRTIGAARHSFSLLMSFTDSISAATRRSMLTGVSAITGSPLTRFSVFVALHVSGPLSGREYGSYPVSPAISGGWGGLPGERTRAARGGNECGPARAAIESDPVCCDLVALFQASLASSNPLKGMLAEAQCP